MPVRPLFLACGGVTWRWSLTSEDHPNPRARVRHQQQIGGQGETRLLRPLLARSPVGLGRKAHDATARVAIGRPGGRRRVAAATFRAAVGGRRAAQVAGAPPWPVKRMQADRC